MLQVKGIVLLSTLHRIRTGLTPARLEALREGMDAGLRALLEGPIDPRGWIPAGALAGLMEAYAGILPDAHDLTYWRLGRHSCDDTLNAIYHPANRLSSPEFILRRAVQVWSDHYDRGEFEVLETLPDSGAVRVTGVGFPHPAFCHRIGGWIERAIELTGGRDVAVEHAVCTFARGEAEEWKARWRL